MKKKIKKKSGFVCILGRPNVGKSTLLNHILQQKVSITSPVPQTTRYSLRGIYNDRRGQIVFVDTPGFYKPEHNLGAYFVKSFNLAQDDADVILYVVDVRRKPAQEEMSIMRKLIRSDKPVIMALNKIDKGEGLQKEYIEYWASFVKKEGKDPVKYFVPISALTGKHTERVVDAIFENLPEMENFYPPDVVTDFPQKFFVADIIREKLYSFLKEEVPHSLGVVVEKIEDKKRLTRIEAIVYVDRASQKNIIIGRKRQVLKEAGILAREELQDLFGKKVYLGLWIKVKQDWRNKPALLREMGFYF